MTAAYAHPEVLVETDWVAQRLEQPDVRVVEVSEDSSLYEKGHIPAAVVFDWERDLEHNLLRDLTDQAAFEQLLGRAGITPETLVVFYGDRSNWFAAYSYWIFEYYGHEKKALMNGGRQKWEAEGRPLTADPPSIQPATYRAKGPNPAVRVLRDEVLAVVQSTQSLPLVDVRSPAEFSGELIAPEMYAQEGARRGGHIPGAINIPWSQACREDGTFKPAAELRALYESKGVTPDKDVIAYCRIGERSSHTWFVLRYLLGYPNVRNYDGSWTEWGSMVGVPIER